MSVQSRNELAASPDLGETPVRLAFLTGLHGKLAEECPKGARSALEDIDTNVLGANEETLINSDIYFDGLSRMEFYASEPAFLIRAGLSQNLTEMGLFGQSVMHSETLWDALQRVRDGLEYMQAGCSFKFSLRLDRFCIDYVNPYDQVSKGALDYQYSVGLLVNLVRTASSFAAANPVVRFPRCRPEHARLFPDAARVAPASHGVVEFDSFLLRRPLEQGNAGLSAAIALAMESIESASPSLHDIVRHLQAAAIQEMHAPIPLNVMSEILSVPSRTLQFDLRRSGHSFAGLRDEARYAAARESLLAGRTVRETSERLGYAQQQSFTEAFIRWEGMAPSTFASRGR